MFINSKMIDGIKNNNISYYVKNHVSSTNDYLNYEYIRDQAPIVVLSNNQRSPRGRRGKRWVNFQGSSLGFSLCLKFNARMNDYLTLSHIAGISIIESCGVLGNSSLKIKWPNDIIQGDGKVCGILIENLLNNESFYSMIGFGFNISIPDNLICFIDGCPDNLDLEKKEIDLIIGTTASIFLKNISLYENHGFSIFQKKWNHYMYAKNKKVIIQGAKKKIIGELLGINNIGELQIEENNKILSISDMNHSMRII